MRQERLDAVWAKVRDSVRKRPWYYKLLLFAGLADVIWFSWKALYSTGWTRVALFGLVLVGSFGLALMYLMVTAAERYDDAPAWWFRKARLATSNGAREDTHSCARRC